MSGTEEVEGMGSIISVEVKESPALRQEMELFFFLPSLSLTTAALDVVPLEQRERTEEDGRWSG